jgi:type I restriction enzyme S subunit
MRAQEMKNRKGFKETKLGWIPEDWEIDKLENYIKIRSGNSSTSFIESKEGINFIKVDDLNNSFKYQIKGKYLVDKKVDYVPVGSVIFPKRGAAIMNNKARISQENLFMDSNLMAITPIEGLVEVEYLYYFILERKLFKIADTSTIPQINNKHINPLKLIIPQLPEQKAIANCLSTWDTAITKQDALIKAKKQLKTGLMQQLLSGKKRLSGFNGEWAIKRFDYFLNYSPRPVEKPKTAFTKLGIRSHCKGTFQNKNFKPSAIGIDTMYLVKPNDLIVNITFAWEGAVAIVKQEDGGALVSHRFPTYEFIDGISDVGFFKQFVQSKWFRYQLDLISPGGAGRNRVLSKKELNKLKIRLPDYKEQTAIAQVLNTADQEINLLINQRNQLQLQKKGLMQQLLTGEKRLKI